MYVLTYKFVWFGNKMTARKKQVRIDAVEAEISKAMGRAGVTLPVPITTHTHTHSHTRTHTHTHTHTFTHSLTHARARAHTPTHTHRCPSRVMRS
jgi:hypothetical protein